MCQWLRTPSTKSFALSVGPSFSFFSLPSFSSLDDRTGYVPSNAGLISLYASELGVRDSPSA